MIGVLNVNKSKNVSSSQVVVKIKKLLNTGKVGHMGTLDPLASGVLPICVGKATRLFDYFLKKQKTYIAQFTFGTQTDTLDLEGEIVKTSNNIPTKTQIQNALPKFIGNIQQIPPMYSSKKIDGKKAYNLARNGVELSLKPCSLTIYEYSLLKQIDDKTFEFKITCSAGTYIRALARDLGEALNSCATMTSLLRTQTGIFNLQNAVDLQTLTPQNISNYIIPLETVLADFEKIVISKQHFQKLLNGLPLNITEFLPLNQNFKAKSQNTKNTSAEIQQKQNKINNQNNLAESQQNFYAVMVEGKIVGIGTVFNNTLKIKTYLIDS